MTKMPRRLAARVILGCAGFWVLSKAVCYLRFLVRTHRMLKRLPSLGSDPNQEALIFGWPASKEFLQGSSTMRVSLDSFRRNLLGGLRRRLERDPELRAKGVLNVWMLNSRIATKIPNMLNLVVVHGPQEVRELLSAKNLDKCVKGQAYEASAPLIGRSILATSGQEWHEQRLILEHGFKDELLRNALEAATESVQQFVNKLSQVAARKETFEASEETLKLTMDVLGKFAFSYDFNSVAAPTTNDAPLYNCFQTILSTLNYRATMPPLQLLSRLPLQMNIDFDEAMRKLNHHVREIVKLRQLTRIQEDIGLVESTSPQDLLDVMLSTAVPGTDHRLSEQQVVDNIQTMLFAGHDTTANVLTMTLYQLAVNDQTYVARLREEFEQVLGTTNPSANPEFDDLQKLTFMDAVLIEVMRLHPPAAFTRRPLEDINIGGYEIPKGVEVVVFPNLTQRDPAMYDRANEFVPERWIYRLEKDNLPLKTEVAVLGRHFAFLPFSLGARNCIGRSLAANLELKLALVKLLQSFNFEHQPGPDFQEDPIIWLTLNPCPIHLLPIPRNYTAPEVSK